MSPRIRIRRMTAGDLDFVFRIQIDPESNRMAVTIPRSPEAFYAVWQKALNDPSNRAFMILFEEKEAGFISCFSRDGHLETGYWIVRELWGRGIASQALRLFLDAVTVRPLWAVAATSNAASLNVLKKCGFELERVEQSPTSERYPACEIAIHILNDTKSDDEADGVISYSRETTGKES